MDYTVPQPKSDLLPRFFTGLIAASATIFLIFQDPIYFKILGVLITFGLLREWSRLCFKQSYHWLNYICLLAVSAAFLPLLYIGSISIILAGCGWLYYLKLFSTKKFIIISLGYIYISIAMGILIHIVPQISGFPFILLMLALVWCVDTGAFLVGRVAGGPKLAPTISPKKTWSGFFGGIAFGFAGTYALITLLNIDTHKFFWSFVSVSVFLSQAGDLLESWCKRYFNVKDTGSFLPGHGGLLDRLDSLLAVSFAAACFWFFCR
ncbi:MAG: phosphatidate cytidylyltransferase [Alphaproteobacteria bacterium]|jgi:phosphatidate cytidylyltransferase|nr:phosphatidate cytidylyltransferase [Alphaproteobacteria bacterium]